VVESMHAQSIDIMAVHFCRMIVQLESEIEESLEGNRECRGGVIQGDLLWFRPPNPKHPDDLTMRGDAVRAQIGCGTHQKEVFLLLAGQSSFLEQDCNDELDLGFHEVGAPRLSAVEIWNEPESGVDCLKDGRSLRIRRHVEQVAHGYDPRWLSAARTFSIIRATMD